MPEANTRTREEILASFSPVHYAAYEAFVHWITIAGIARQSAKVGDVAPDFLLPDADGRLVTSLDLRAQGPVVISFVRGDWCTFCKAELCALYAALPDIESLNASLVVVTPDTGDYPRMLKRRLGLDRLKVLADVDYGVGLNYGIIFSVPPDIRRVLRECDIDLPARHGSPAWMLPIPATYVLDQDSRVRQAHVEPDFSLRQDPKVIVEQLRQMRTVAASTRRSPRR